MTSPYSVATVYSYSNTAPQVKVTIAVAPQRWTKKYLDGFGRTVKAESEYTQNNTDTVVSVIETQYEPCACTPMGKVKRVSQPHAPGAAAVWTEYVPFVIALTFSQDSVPLHGSIPGDSDVT